MVKKEFPYLFILLFVIVINLFFSTYFITIFLIGIVFSIFIDVLKKEHFYIFMLVIFTFCMIETIHGLKIFSLTLISLFLYYFVIPRIKHIFSSSVLGKITYILSFYLCFYLFSFFTNYHTSDIYMLFILNFLLDSFIVGLFI